MLPPVLVPPPPDVGFLASTPLVSSSACGSWPLVSPSRCALPDQASPPALAASARVVCRCGGALDVPGRSSTVRPCV